MGKVSAFVVKEQGETVVMIVKSASGNPLVNVRLDSQGSVVVIHWFSPTFMPMSDLDVAAEAFALASKVTEALMIDDADERRSQLSQICK